MIFECRAEGSNTKQIDENNQKLTSVFDGTNTVPTAAASLDEPEVVEGVKLLTFCRCCCCCWSRCFFSFAFECALFRLVMKTTPLARVERQLAWEPRNVASGWMSERPRGEFHTRCVGMETIETATRRLETLYPSKPFADEDEDDLVESWPPPVSSEMPPPPPPDSLTTD